MIQGPQPLGGWEQDMDGHCDVPCARFSKNIKSNMHETVTGVGQQLPSSFSLSLSLSPCTLFHSLVSRKSHLEDCDSLMLGELKIEAAALKNQELSRCFVYILPLDQSLSTAQQVTDNAGDTAH